MPTTQTQNTNTPTLRFPGFSDCWEEKKIGKILKIGSGRDFKHLGEGNIPVYGTGGYMTSVNDFLYDGESVCIGRKGTIDKPRFINGKFWTVDTLFYTHSFNNSIPKFIYLLFQNINRLKYNEASGVPSLSKSTIESIKLNIPSLPEQEKIASFLTTVDQKIEKIREKKGLLEEYKKGLMQKLFSQELRFPGFSDKNRKKRKFSDVLFEHKNKSTGNEKVFSVSVHKGLINQIEHLGRNFAAKDTNNYNIVHSYDIVYTKSPTGDFPYGIIKQSRIKEDVIVSPLYGVFKPETPGLGYILHTYFESIANTHNYLHSIIQKGAKNTINITNNTFLSKSLFLPTSKEEQEKIANFLSAIDEKIEKIDSELNGVVEWKKGLLQGLFV